MFGAIGRKWDRHVGGWARRILDVGRADVLGGGNDVDKALDDPVYRQAVDSLWRQRRLGAALGASDHG
jgi:hypothetical protein